MTIDHPDFNQLHWAVIGDRIDDLQSLLETLSVASRENWANELLVTAATFGRPQALAVILPLANPTYNQSQALLNAAARGRADVSTTSTSSAYLACVELLAPVSDIRSWGASIWNFEISTPAKALIEKYQLKQTLDLAQNSPKSPRL